MDPSREWLSTLGLVSVALLVGAVTGAWGWSLFIASVTWIALHMREFRKIQRWSQRPLQRPENATESWFDIAYQPFRALQRQRQRTQQVAARFRQILRLFEHIPDGVIVLNATGEIEGMNQSAVALLQLTDADRGLMLSTIVRSPSFIRFLKDHATDEPLEFASPVQENVTLEARRFDIDEQGSIVLIRDITTLNRLLTVRQEFVANVSHELRTPLAVVRGYLETLLDPEEDDALKLKLLPRLEGPMQRMQTLVDDLMLLTRLESGDETRRHSPLNLRRIVEDSVREITVLADSHRLNVSIETDSKIYGSEAELRSVCANLLSNAIRYSPDGGDITVRLWEEDDRVHLSVKDCGVGIAPEHLSRLTERFYRVDMADARARGGTGLGLAIVKHVLRHHDSGLEISSTLGEGSTFSCAFDTYHLDNQEDEETL